MAGMYGCFKSRNSDSAAMASGPQDVTANQEPAEVAEECSGKKKSKFQTFKKFFARKKRKEPPAAGADAGLKASQSSDNVSKTSENNTLTRSEKDKGSGSKISLGSKALSHDSVFVSDSSEANEALGASQDSIHGKVKSLQLQLKQAIRLGSPPSLMCVKRIEDAGTMSEDDGLPCSPPEYTTPHTAGNQPERNSSISLEGIDSDDDQLSCAASSRAVSPLVVPGDFSQPASPFGCLDNSAAKHKLGLRYKACNRRKPATRLEVKTEADSVVEKSLNMSTTEASEEKEQQKAAEDLVVSADELKPKVEREGEEDEEKEKEEEEEEEEEQPQNLRRSLLSDKEEKEEGEEEGEDESETEPDVSHGPDTSSRPELCLSEEEAPDAQPLLSSKPSSRASSLDSPGATPEPPAGPREYLMDPPGIAYGAEEPGAESDLVLQEDEDGVQEKMEEEEEEESSFLQEVLSSLKTPLASCSLGMDTEAVVLEIKEEEKTNDGEDSEVKEEEEVKEEKDEPVSYQAAPAGSHLSDETNEEEEEEEEDVAALSTSSAPRHDVEEKENVEENEEEQAEEEEGEHVVGQFSHLGEKEEEEKDETEEVKPEEQSDLLTENTVNQVGEGGRGEEEEEDEEEEGESEGEEEAIELEKEPEAEEEGREKMEEEAEVEEAKGRVEEAEEAIEDEREEAEEMTEVLPGAADEGVQIVLLETDEGVDAVAGDDSVHTTQRANDDEIPDEPGDQIAAIVHEGQEASCQSLGEEGVEEGVEIDHTEQKSDQEEEGEASQPDADQTEQDMEQEGGEGTHSDVKQVEKDPTEAAERASKPPPLTLSESQCKTQPRESGAITPSKTSTTTLHINLLSPSQDKAKSFFQQSPTSAHPKDSETSSHDVAATEEESAGSAEREEEEKASTLEEEASEKTGQQPSSASDQSKVRFTIAPAWQRSISVEDVKESSIPPSAPPTSDAAPSPAVPGPGAAKVEATAKNELEVKAEPASPTKVELVLSPSRVRNTGSTTAKQQSSTTSPPPPVRTPTSAAAGSEESSVVVEGNPDNPFGVRLRKTSVLHRFSSEEENTEPPAESPAQQSSCKVEPQQPVSAKPAISPPVSIKPALPKKPDVHVDAAVKNKRISEPAAAHGVSAGSDSPSWISVAKQKQKIYKENSLEEIAVKKEDQERKSSMPMYVSSAVSREHSSKTAESTTGKVSPLDISKPPVSVEKEARRALSPPAPVPPQPPKPQSLPCPVPPKPQVPPAATKPTPQPIPLQRSLSPPTPVPIPQKSPSCTSPPPPSKTATSPKSPQPQSTTVTSPPFSSRTAPEKPAQRGSPAPALPQDEPPWMALAKKKAKAWSEMPQIVQ